MPDTAALIDTLTPETSLVFLSVLSGEGSDIAVKNFD
jgi:hypothetical protein